MTTTEDSKNEPGRFAGFWRRLFAFGLDSVVLGILGICLGYFLYDYFASIGGWGRVIGFAIALTYFGVMNSDVSGGQTFGKKIAKIRVVSINGGPLRVETSVLRSCVFCVPFFLNGAPFDVELAHSWFLWVLAILVFGVGLSMVYLFIFNRKTRQSLHDLAVGSCVIRAGVATAPVSSPAIWRVHWAVVVVLIALSAGIPIITGQLSETEPFASLWPLQRAIADEPGVGNVMVRAGSSFSTSVQKGSQSSTFLSTSVVIESKDIDHEALANKIAEIALVTFEAANQKDYISVSLNYGYDIGIASAWKSQSYSYSPAEWHERLVLKTNSAVQRTLRE